MKAIMEFLSNKATIEFISDKAIIEFLSNKAINEFLSNKAINEFLWNKAIIAFYGSNKTSFQQISSRFSDIQWYAALEQDHSVDLALRPQKIAHPCSKI